MGFYVDMQQHVTFAVLPLKHERVGESRDETTDTGTKPPRGVMRRAQHSFVDVFQVRNRSNVIPRCTSVNYGGSPKVSSQQSLNSSDRRTKVQMNTARCGRIFESEQHPPAG